MLNTNSTPKNLPAGLMADAEATGLSVYASSQILEQWLFRTLPKIAVETQRGVITASVAETLCRSAEEDNQAIRQSLIRSLLLPQPASDRRELLALNQSLIGSIMNRLADLQGWKTGLEATSQLVTELQTHFETTLSFLQQNFPDYFDGTRPLPAFSRKKFAHEVEEGLTRLKGKLDLGGQDTHGLVADLVSYVHQRFATDGQPVNFADVLQTRALLVALESRVPDSNSESTLQLLYEMNFNETWFVEKECERLGQQAAFYDAPKQRIAVLKLEQKQLNQQKVSSRPAFNAALPTLKVQLNAWIDEEVKFLEGGYAANVAVADGQVTDKIHTSLSVAKLAVIVRLLVLDKIIINRAAAPMLRVVAKMFTTLQRDDISFISLETKYHAPDKATVTAVRDMLFKWIRLIDKL